MAYKHFNIELNKRSETPRYTRRHIHSWKSFRGTNNHCKVQREKGQNMRKPCMRCNNKACTHQWETRQLFLPCRETSRKRQVKICSMSTFNGSDSDKKKLKVCHITGRNAKRGRNGRDNNGALTQAVSNKQQKNTKGPEWSWVVKTQVTKTASHFCTWATN
jgi:hypothetical protein